MEYPGFTIKKGSKEKDLVTLIQHQLNIKGLGPLEEDGDFGDITASAIREFQSQSRDSLGNPLVCDGKVGPITWSVLFGTATTPTVPPSPPGLLLAKTIEVAASQLGVMEDPPGSNTGPRVNQYLARVGLNPGLPWCASFIYWCFSEASKATGIMNPLPKTGSCMGHWDSTRGHRILKQQAANNPDVIKPGHIFIMDHGNYRGHTGLVTAINNGYIETIEGNSALNGSREGLAVVTLRRKIISIYPGFIEYNV